MVPRITPKTLRLITDGSSRDTGTPFFDLGWAKYKDTTYIDEAIADNMFACNKDSDGNPNNDILQCFISNL